MVGFVHLRDLNDGRFYSVYEISMMFVLFGHEMSLWPVLSGYEISLTVSFVPLRDFNDSRFSLSVIFLQLQDLILVCFVLLRDFNDGRFCSVNDVILIHRVILVIPLFFPLQDFKDSE